jgi:hypothetical protein
MKKVFLFSATILLFTACKKNKSNGVDQTISERYPQTWILTIDESPDKYIFLKTNGAVLYRDHVPRSYSLVQLAEDENCEWEVEQSRTEDGTDICYNIRLKKNKKIWIGAAPSSDRNEMHLVALNSTGTGDLDDDNYKFFIHKMPDVNGVKTVVLESVYFSGYYISSSSPGWQFAQNLGTLQQASSPEKATRWQCRHN